MTAAAGAADMSRGDRRARALELIDVAEDALRSRDHEWAGACAALASAYLQAARPIKADRLTGR